MIFRTLKLAKLRQWAKDHPRRINERDSEEITALYSAVVYTKNLVLVQWLVDTQGADVNGRAADGWTPLHRASPPIIRALLERNADPTIQAGYGWTALMYNVYHGRHECVACLLENRRVRDTINTSLFVRDSAWLYSSASCLCSQHPPFCSSRNAAPSPGLRR